LLGSAAARHSIEAGGGVKHRIEGSILRWEPYGVLLDRAPWGVGEASEPIPRANLGYRAENV